MGVGVFVKGDLAFFSRLFCMVFLWFELRVLEGQAGFGIPLPRCGR